MGFFPMHLHNALVVAVASWFADILEIVFFAWPLANSPKFTACALNGMDNQESLRVTLLIALGTRE